MLDACYSTTLEAAPSFCINIKITTIVVGKKEYIVYTINKNKFSNNPELENKPSINTQQGTGLFTVETKIFIIVICVAAQCSAV